MSATVTGLVISSAPAGGQAQDSDGILALQTSDASGTPTKVFVLSDPRTLHASYAIPGAALMGAGPGASRGLSGAAVPPGGEPYVGYSLHATLEVVAPAPGSPTGTLSMLRVATGLANTVVGLDANANAVVPNALTIGSGGSAPVTFDAPGDGSVSINANAIRIASLPTTQPTPVAGYFQLWNNGGVLSVA